MIVPFIVITDVPSDNPVTVPSSATVATLGVPDVYVKSSTSPLGVVVPINLITVGAMTIFGIPALLSFIVMLIVMF